MEIPERDGNASVLGQFSGSRLYGQLKPGLINAGPLVRTYPALLGDEEQLGEVQ